MDFDIRYTPKPPFSADHSRLTGRDRGFWRSRWFSFRAAFDGVWHTVRTQPNAQIELAALLLVTAAGWLFRISLFEWGLLGLTFFAVLALEAVNTAVEALVDLVSPEYHPLARVAKDAAAGAMVFVVLGSLCVAAVVFAPRVWTFVAAFM
ncbi:MAG: diacylglycerol kinase family protein [Caldilineaceae bacterium]|nr:diacylglycerol kinase family protein [Caldilineaceae bacterium]